jgi:hypothetical protein
MRPISSTILLILLIAINAAAQSVKQVIAVPQEGNKEAGIIVSFDSYGSLPPSVATASKYSLFGFDPKNMGAPNEDLSGAIQAATVSCVTLGGYCEIRRDALAGMLNGSKTYILGIDDFSKPGEREVFTFKLAEKAAIRGPLDPSSAREALRIVAPMAIRTVSGSPNSVVIERETLVIGNGSFYVQPKSTPIPVKSAVLEKSQQNVINVTLASKLEEGRIHALIITQGIVTNAAPLPSKPITGRGGIELGGLPSNPDAPKISSTFSSNAGVGQKAFWDLKLDFKPKNQPIDLTSGAIWKPSAAIDIGLRSTKSSNSIVLSFVRSNSYMLCPKNLFMTQSEKDAEEAEERALREYERQNNLSPPKKTKPACGQDKVVIPDPNLPQGAIITNAYANWSSTPWTRRSHIGFEWGPKLEADRDFNKVNILGNVRLDFVFHRWLGTINYQRRLILLDDEFADDRKTAAGKLEGPFFGFTLVPYLAFDLGRRAYSETIKKKVTQQINGQPVTVETSVTVPGFTVARANLGFTSSFEWYTFKKIPTTLTLNESVIFIGSTESVGFTTDQGAFLRRVRGFHPSLKTSLDFAIDPARHYSFNITWDNGRTPPNFEYLNKLSTGLKVIY